MLKNTLFPRWEVQASTCTLARADLDPEVRLRVGLEVLVMTEGFEVIMQIRLLQLSAAEKLNRHSDVIRLIPSFLASSDYFSWLCGFLKGRSRGLSAHTNISHTSTTREAFELLEHMLDICKKDTPVMLNSNHSVLVLHFGLGSVPARVF